MAESEHVFIHGNQLFTRWKNHDTDCTIAETGFGTGLNFLTTCYHWRQQVRTGGRLVYIAFESHPLTNSQIEYALSAFPQLKQLTNRLTAILPPLIQGSYLLHYDDNIDVILHYGHTESLLPQLNFQANAWYLDGFAPSRNADIWSATICQHIARCSATNATLATFTVARHVREQLAEHGFTLQKKIGFGNKRHMLVGQRGQPQAAATDRAHKKIAIIGAGFAGISTAAALAQQGLHTDIYEAQPTRATRASSNQSAILHYKPEWLASESQKLKWAAYIHALSWYTSQQLKDALRTKPILLAPTDSRGQKWLQRWHQAFRSRPLQGYMAQFHQTSTADHSPALLFPRSGTINLPQACQALVEGYQIPVYTNQPIHSIASTQSGYILHTAQGTTEEYSHVILTVNAGITDFSSTYPAAIRQFKGQIDRYAPVQALQSTPHSVYCSSAFANYSDTACHIGAGFRMRFDDLQPENDSRIRNWQQLRQDFPHITLPEQHLSSWCDIRTATKDYLPATGRIAQHPTQAYQGIYINLGHGGKGSLMIPLSAQLLAQQIQGQCLLPQYALLDPHRLITEMIEK